MCGLDNIDKCVNDMFYVFVPIVQIDGCNFSRLQVFIAFAKETLPEMSREERNVVRWHRFTILWRCFWHHKTLLDMMCICNAAHSPIFRLEMLGPPAPNFTTGFRDCSPGSHSHVHHQPDPEAEPEEVLG